MSSTPTSTRPGGAAFTEARGCKEWLSTLPLTNIPQGQTLVLEALRALNRTAEIEPIERLKCLELLRDKIAFLQGEQRGRYFGKTLPLSPMDAAAWSTGRALLEEMETGYRAALAAIVSLPDLGRHAALVLQRIARYLGAQMLFHAIVYRRFDPVLWTRLHALYAEAEGRGAAEESVKDSLEGEEGLSSVAEAYARVVLTQAAYLSEMSAPQMDLAEALLRLWVRKVKILREAPAGSDANALYPLAVDLDKPIGARPVFGDTVVPSHRILDVEQLSKSMRRRIRGLQNEEEPATLGLPPEATSALDALQQLQRLHRLWCEGAPPRPPAKVPDEKEAGVAFGVSEIHFFVSGGAAFEQPDKKRELTRQEKDDIAMFGRVTERTQTLMVSEYNFVVEKWAVVDEMLGAWRLLRPANAAKGIAIGRLVAMRMGDGAPLFLGMVSALVQETDGRIIITVTLFPGRPEPIAVRAGDARNRSNAQWVQGFRLPAIEKINIPASIVVPGGIAFRGRGVETWIDAAKESTVYEVLEHGTDFDRVTVF